MPRVAKPIVFESRSFGELSDFVLSQGDNPAVGLRAEIVRQASRGASNQEIAAALNVPAVTVGKWRRAYLERGVEGLLDAPRKGRPRKYPEEARRKVQTRVLQRPKDGGKWSVRTLAEDLKLPASSVQKILSASNLQPRRVRAAFLGAETGSTPRKIEIAGMYRGPNGSALVLCADGGRKRAPKRVFDGSFPEFMDGIATAYPSGSLHAVVDRPDWSDPRAQFHYASSHTAWAGMVELFLSLLAEE